MTIDLDALEKLCAEATALPWQLHLVDDTTIIDREGRFVASVCGGDDDLAERDYNNPDDWPGLEANARLIAASRTAIPALIARVRKLEAAAEDALSGWRYIRKQHGDLYGVGWDRVEQKLCAALTAKEGEG